ncbi:hypothetical protein ACFPM7_18965 [Actinokineospora guangxiensis]|uniref:PPE domain-containing protein n=1 Tax=Actinokineospora guangxiensis TaxID=1490288 RepID=A0ABW0EQS7_9PSEU
MGILALPVAAVIIPLAIRAGADPNGVIARLSRGEYGEQAMPIPDVIQAVREGSSEGWHIAASASNVLAAGHVDAVGQATQLLEDVGAGWQGDAAALALRRIMRMIKVSEQASESYEENAKNLTGVAGEFDALKRSVEDMPPHPPDKSLWDIVTPWQTDTEAAISEYNAKATENLEKYNSYASSVESATQRLKLHYGHVEQFDADSPPPPPERDDRGYSPDPGHTVVAAYGGGGGSGPVTPAWTPQGQASAHPPSQGGIGVVPPVPAGTTPSAVASRAPGHAAAATPRVGGGGSGPAGGSPVVSGPYAGGPHARGGAGGTGGPPASGQRPGVESRSGSGAPTSAAPAGQGRAVGAVPPAGSSRSRSEGDDDGEHLDELTRADDALFQLDRKAVDPSTGMRVMDSGSLGG